MAMPHVSEAHWRLAAFEGEWVGEERIHASVWSAQAGQAEGRISAWVALDGFFLLANYVQERDGHVVYRGHGVYGYDAVREVYQMWWFDSTGSGFLAPAEGRWSGDVLPFETLTPQGQVRYEYALDGEDGFTYGIHSSSDGKEWQPYLEARYRRVGGK